MSVIQFIIEHFRRLIHPVCRTNSVTHLARCLTLSCVQKALQERGRQFINQQSESAVIALSSSSPCSSRVDSRVPGMSAGNPSAGGCSHVSRLSLARRRSVH
jgi:hypothetical protein